MARKVDEPAHKEVNRTLAESRPINATKAIVGSWRNNCAYRVRRIASRRSSLPSSLIRPRVTKARGPYRAGALVSLRGTSALQMQNVDYLLPLFLAALSSLLPWPAGLRASPFLEPVLIPVVVPDFTLLDVIR